MGRRFLGPSAFLWLPSLHPPKLLLPVDSVYWTWRLHPLSEPYSYACYRSHLLHSLKPCHLHVAARSGYP